MLKSSRRQFVKTTAAIGAGLFVAPQVWSAEKSPNERVRYAIIGCGGKGQSDSDDAANHGDIVAICDIDELKMADRATSEKFAKAEQFTDWRVMFDKMEGKIDAITCSTPDHHHAPATARALRAKIASYTQKPLTHTVWEARRLAELAKEFDVPTQMGNQGTAGDGLRKAAALMKSGFLGKIKEVHVSTNRPIWPQGGPRGESMEIPEGVNWDLWLGSAAVRPYAAGYHAFAWRGWWDFGTGALGDMACHTFNMPFAGLGLANPISIQASTSKHNGDTYPQSSKIKFEFKMGEDIVPVYWYDGDYKPEDSLLGGTMKLRLDDKGRHSGAIIVAENGTLYTTNDYGADWVVLKNGEPIEVPEVEFEKSPGHFTEFHESITGARKRAMSNFETYAGPLTETILLGNLAVWAAADGECDRIEWNSEKLEAVGHPELSAIINKTYRNGYGEFLKY